MKKLTVLTVFLVGLTMSYAKPAFASNVFESSDSLTPVEALGRFQWLDKCYSGLLLELSDRIFDPTTPIPNDQKIANLRNALLYKNGVLRSDANYPTFGNGDQENPQRWLAGTSSQSDCYQIPSDYGVSAILVTSTLPRYCSANSVDSDYEYIRSVQFSDLTNESEESYYSNFIGQAALIQKHAKYEVTLTPGFTEADESYPETFHLFVDWNRDGDFSDPSEASRVGVSSTALTHILTPPSTAVSGLTKMRVTMDYFGGHASACKNIRSGEVEDYLLYIK
jgi:hypothetical protein